VKVCVHCHAVFDSESWQCPSCNASPRVLDGYLSFLSDYAAEYEGFNREYFDDLAPLEETNFWFRARNRLIIWALREYFAAAKNFYEIGCGTGYVLSGVGRSFPHLSLFGSEIFKEGIFYAAERAPAATFFQMDARSIPFKDEFDVIGAFDVLEHISEDEGVLQQMFQAVRPNGGVILTVPQHQFLWSKADDYACHVRRYAAKDLNEKVVRAGFQVLRVTSFVSLLLPFMMISRLIPCRKKDDYDPLAELKMSGPVNSLFEKCLDFERALIVKGLNLPMGGSLLLIAKKI